MIEGKARVVAIANGSYARLPALTRAVPDARELANMLHARNEFEERVLPSLERGALRDQIDEQLGENVLVDGNLIVVWIGHGKIGADHTLRLLAPSEGKDGEVGSAGQLGEWAARTGARQVLVVIDTCFSGGGVVDAVQLAEAVNSGRTLPGQKWFGVIAASLKDEPARSGALVSELIRLLKEGPRQADFRWDRKRPYIRGDDLLQALLADWSEPRQQPYPISVGKAWDIIRNPRFEPGIPDQPVEHLLLAARGGSGEESYFTGRESALDKIVKWVRTCSPGLFVLTGPPGCGKSAVAGRIVSMSSSAERKRLLATAQIPAELDPGEGSVDAQLHARGFMVDSASEELARQLGLDPNAGPHGFLAEAYRRRKAGDPLVVVIDGLDEAGLHSRNIAVELIDPLAREALVLVATRDAPCGEKNLIAQLGPAAQVLDLGQDIEGTRQDIATYVKRRLAGVMATMDPDLVAAEIATGGGSSAPQFLLARLVTSQLREHPVDTLSDGWRLVLATTVESALERDVQSVVLTIAGKPHPTAAREMISALALSHGGGFPADDIWPAVATAISPTGTAYTREDAFAVLAALGRHLISGSEGDQPVYRIAHQRLVDYLIGNAAAAAAGAGPPNTAAAVGTAILAEYDRLLDAGLGPRAHTYLWRHAWRHLAEAGSSGLAGLRHLVERDQEAFLPDLAAGLELATDENLVAGQTTQALELINEAVDVRRKLGDSLKLAMALFKLTFVQAAVGDASNADEASAEASELARAADDRPESRAVLGAVLLARAHSQLLDGHYRGAMLLAKEAIELIEAGGTADEKGAWPEQAAAYSVMSRAAFTLEDFETAATMCHRAVDLIDRHSRVEDENELRTETLSVLAAIQLTKAVLSSPDATGTYIASMTTAAQRILDEYHHAGRRETIGDISVSRGIVSYVRARLLDLSRGINVTDADALPPLVNEAIELARPFAGRVLDGAVAFADGVALLLLFQGLAAPDGTAADCVEAERCLRQFASTNDLAAVALGSLLDAENAVQMTQVIQGAVSDPSGIVARQKEAVSLLRRCGAWFARYQLAQDLSRLSTLLLQFGVSADDQATPIRAEAIEVWRSLVGRVPDAPVQLVGLLCDQAAVLIQNSPGEAADLARQAIELTDSLPQPQFAGLTGIAETNLAGALLALGGAPDTRELLRQAIGHLDPLVPDPIFSGVLANTCVNLAHVELGDSHFSEALSLAERAVALFDTPGVLPVVVKNRPLALLALGRAQRGMGQVEAGTATLHEVIGKLSKAAENDERSAVILADALNFGAPDFWDEVLTSFAGQPDLRRTINLLRWRSPAEISITVGDIVEALVSRPSTEHRFLREIARKHRSRMSSEFDAMWQEKAGTIPRWLQLDPAHEWRVIAWWNTGNWRLSRDYLKSYPALLDASTDIVLEEFGLQGIDKNLLDTHRQLLDDARKLGADAAYAPLLAALEVKEWVQSDDPEQYLAEHGELQRPEIRAVLREAAGSGDASSAVFAAILDLAQRGESHVAFQATEESESIHAHLQAAWRSQDISRLASLATIVQGCTEDDRTRRISTLVLAIARVLEHAPEQAGTLIARNW
jgi:tetratricopeptide (TPR) repeat protein